MFSVGPDSGIDVRRERIAPAFDMSFDAETLPPMDVSETAASGRYVAKYVVLRKPARCEIPCAIIVGFSAVSILRSRRAVTSTVPAASPMIGASAEYLPTLPDASMWAL